MNRKEFIEKHNDAIIGIFEAGGKQDDESVCCDKLISSIRGHFGETFTDGTGEHTFETYPGIPENFDWDQAYADYKELIKE